MKRAYSTAHRLRTDLEGLILSLPKFQLLSQFGKKTNLVSQVRNSCGCIVTKQDDKVGNSQNLYSSTGKEPEILESGEPEQEENPIGRNSQNWYFTPDKSESLGFSPFKKGCFLGIQSTKECKINQHGPRHRKNPGISLQIQTRPSKQGSFLGVFLVPTYQEC